MLQRLLNTGFFNLSVLAEKASIKKQNLHKFKNTGKGLSVEKQDEVLGYINEVFYWEPKKGVRKDKVDVKESEDSKSTKAENLRKIITDREVSKEKLIERSSVDFKDKERITPAEYEELTLEGKALFYVDRVMGKVCYKRIK
jgi:DNA-binding Xre family transcriptional regulator